MTQSVENGLRQQDALRALWREAAEKRVDGCDWPGIVLDLFKHLDDLRSRLACVAEATYWDRPYDTRIAAIRGMCDLTANGHTTTPIPPGSGDAS